MRAASLSLLLRAILASASAAARVVISMCRFLLAVVAAGGCLASHERAVHAHTPTPVAKDVRVTTLANGLRVVVASQPDAPLLAANLSVGVGAVDDPPGKFGMAHLLEHVTTATVRGSRSRHPRRYVETLERRGAIGVNATTAWDATQYFAQFPADVLALWLELEATRLRHPTFDEFEAERAAAAQEARQSPSWDDLRPLFRRVFPQSDRLHAPFGVPEQIERIDRPTAAAFMRDYYRPDRIVITLVGAVDLDRARRICEAWFGNWRPVAPRVAEAIDPDIGVAAIMPSMGPTTAQALVGVPRESLSAADAVALDVLATAIGAEGLTALSLAAAARSGLSRARAMAAFPGLRGPSTFTLVLSADRPMSVADNRHMVQETVHALERAPDAALAGAILLTEAAFEERFDDAAALAATLSQYEMVYGSALRAFDELDTLATLAPAGLRTAFARMIRAPLT